MANVLVISLDFDSCTDTERARECLKSWLIDYLLKHEEITDVEFHLNTARIGVHEDYIMANQCRRFHGKLFSCSQLERSFLPAFREQLGMAFAEIGKEAPNVRFEKLVLGDVLKRLHPGTMVAHMQEAMYEAWNRAKFQGERVFFTVPGLSESAVVLYDSSVQYDPYAKGALIDSSKFLTMYMHLQNIGSREQRGDTYHIKMLDDRADVLNRIKERFSSRLELIPENCTLQTIPFCLDSTPRHAVPLPLEIVSAEDDVMRGRGVANPQYAEDISAVAEVMQAEPRHMRYPNPEVIFQHMMRRLLDRQHHYSLCFFENNGSDIGDEEMAESVFGQSSDTATRLSQMG